MAATLKVVNALRRIGMKNSGGEDTHLVYVNDEEYRRLGAEGGSGKPDPQTGIPHFYRESDRAERGRSTDGGDSESSGGDGSTSDGGTDSGGGVEGGARGVAEGISAAISGAIDKGVTNALGSRKSDNGGDVRPSTASFGTLTPAQAENLSTPGTPQDVYGIDAAKQFNTGSALRAFFKGLSTGSPLVAAGTALTAGVKNATGSDSVNGGGWGENGGVTNSDGSVDSDRSGVESKGGDDLTDKQRVAASAAAAAPPLQDPADTGTASAVDPTTSDIDLFSTLSRNRYTRKNQMMGGLLNSTNYNLLKPTLGV